MIGLVRSEFKFAASARPVGPIWIVRRAARYVRIHPRTLSSDGLAGKTPSIQIGRLWRFRRADLDDWFRDILRKSFREFWNSLWPDRVRRIGPHDLCHCLTNLALAKVPINGIKEYAGHASIVETQKYLKFMPQSVELAASVSTRLTALANVGNGSINGQKDAKSASKAKTL